MLEWFLSKLRVNRSIYSAEAVFYAWNPSPDLLHSCQELYIEKSYEMGTVILNYYTNRWISVYVFL